VIREARPTDRPGIERLQQLLPEPAPELLSAGAGGKILVSTNPGARPGDDVPVGYLLWLSGEPVYVAELVVALPHRREGRGRRLLQALFDRLPAGTAVVLRVAAENEDAQRLYRELGFECVETVPDLYESGDGYRMRTVVEK
jgi:ribosomal-protein-alanine N-acetyltransferase